MSWGERRGYVLGVNCCFLWVDSQPIEVNLMNSATINEEKLRASLLQLVSTHCCWGKRAAENMHVSEFTSIDSYHCQWTTFMEKRWVSQAERPYNHGFVCSIPSIDVPNVLDWNPRYSSQYVRNDSASAKLFRRKAGKLRNSLHGVCYCLS